jgi:hypothetical protein
LQQQLLDQFGGLTFFPQPNEGVWTVAGLTYRDAMVIYRMLTSDEQGARQFLSALKAQLKEEPQQEDSLIIERDVETLERLLIFCVTDFQERRVHSPLNGAKRS